MAAADGIAAALAFPNEQEACRRFCTEVLQAARRWGPPEQRMLFEQLPVVLNRLYAWVSLPGAGTEEAILRTFHPGGPLASHLSVWKAASFVFPLRRLPPRALRAAVLASTDWLGARQVPGVAQPADLGSPWFNLLGASRLARSPGGGLEGVAMTGQEFLLTALIHQLICDQSQWPRPPGLPGRGGAGGLGGFGGGSAAPGAFQAAPGVGGGGFVGAGGSSNGAMQPAMGNVSITFERLLLAHLQHHLPHSVYEVAQAQEPRASRFLLFLLHEFLLAPQPIADALPADLLTNAVRFDGRSRPGALHASRLLALHVLANPALQSGCEESLQSAGLGVAGGTTMAVHRGSGAARLTRDVELLVPPLVGLAAEMLNGPASGKHMLLETLSSVMRLWLVVLQPWKAPRLYKFYNSSRSPNPKLDPAELSSVAGGQAGGGSSTTRQAASNRYVDVALLGLEPEAPAGPGQNAQATNVPYAPEGTGAPTEPVSMLAAAVPGSLALAAAMPLLPGAGNAQTWRSYVCKFQGAYCLFEAFLVTPVHSELCLMLCKNLAENRSSYAVVSRRHILVTMKVLAQTLLCFTDPALLQVLSELPPSRQSSPGMPIIIDGGLHPETVRAVSLTWAALLGVHKDFRDAQNELNPLLCAISRQFGQTPLWQPHGLALITESSTHRPFAQKIVQSLLQAPAAQAAPQIVAAGPQFVGSEWQRPKRGGEVEILLLCAYYLAMLIDRLLGRDLKVAGLVPQEFGCVPQTEWPRLFANWKFAASSGLMVFWAVLW